MKPIKKLSKIELSNKIVKDDIEDINKYGLWSYMTTDKNDPNAVRERNYKYNKLNNKLNDKNNLKCTNYGQPYNIFVLNWLFETTT